MVTIFSNTSDIGGLISSTTSNVTGDLSMTLLLIVVLLFMIAMLFKEPFILFGLIILPLIIIFAIYEAQTQGLFGNLFYSILSIVGLIIAWQFAKVIMGWGR